MQVIIITPEKEIYSGEAKSVAVPGINGSFQMLDNHAPIVSVLKEGAVRIEKPENDKLKYLKQTDKKNFYEVVVSGGIIEMSQGKLSILVE